MKNEVEIRKLSEEERKKLGVEAWPIWTCDPSTFDWHYDDDEDCCILEGQVTVRTPAGEVSFGPGDYVSFPKGLSCTWVVSKAVRKHYRFR
ncbi:MAG: cupin [Candidatus Lindowbacteria bacterium RIFCSPLOWO2_12_FULL_62_27]|nr:MAG: cupin [Candidatus Lindowbacteria bacterium RIFCSPLOWO2_02_FULL_62_12]OGH59541.1 MAG: cupin [Candidatus Lindowbacteria bacterium RIFCSPLOWO2_12_FULL_62_27]